MMFSGLRYSDAGPRFSAGAPRLSYRGPVRNIPAFAVAVALVLVLVLVLVLALADQNRAAFGNRSALAPVCMVKEVVSEVSDER
ncbi:MAG: hypothetical protein H7306_15375 [Bacteriovorax sp.]|nr:hypothetical protein [Rhizobacter sp.]